MTFVHKSDRQVLSAFPCEGQGDRTISRVFRHCQAAKRGESVFCRDDRISWSSGYLNLKPLTHFPMAFRGLVVRSIQPESPHVGTGQMTSRFLQFQEVATGESFVPFRRLQAAVLLWEVDGSEVSSSEPRQTQVTSIR